MDEAFTEQEIRTLSNILLERACIIRGEISDLKTQLSYLTDLRTRLRGMIMDVDMEKPKEETSFDEIMGALLKVPPKKKSKKEK